MLILEKQTPVPSMALELITSLSLEKDPARMAEEEIHAKLATGIAYAGNTILYFRTYESYLTHSPVHLSWRRHGKFLLVTSVSRLDRTDSVVIP